LPNETSKKTVSLSLEEVVWRFVSLAFGALRVLHNHEDGKIGFMKRSLISLKIFMSANEGNFQASVFIIE
jgi:hypothetical protein